MESLLTKQIDRSGTADVVNIASDECFLAQITQRTELILMFEKMHFGLM